jgi:hypothetical protein
MGVHVDQARQDGERTEIEDLHSARDGDVVAHGGDALPFHDNDRIANDGAGADVDQAARAHGDECDGRF